ncbi:MAG: hypothetical protein ACXWPM_03610 [Bdellovibrionota bacterium]
MNWEFLDLEASAVALLLAGAEDPKLRQALLRLGLTVAWGEEDPIDAYARALGDPRGLGKPVVVIGFGGSADAVAGRFYDFLAIEQPLAVVLIHTHARARDLGKITCPFLIIHGERDPILREDGDGSFREAVLHHQKRYGDATTGILLPYTGVEMSSEAIEEIAWWLSHAVIRRSLKTARAA